MDSQSRALNEPGRSPEIKSATAPPYAVGDCPRRPSFAPLRGARTGKRLLTRYRDSPPGNSPICCVPSRAADITHSVRDRAFREIVCRRPPRAIVGCLPKPPHASIVARLPCPNPKIFLTFRSKPDLGGAGPGRRSVPVGPGREPGLGYGLVISVYMALRSVLLPSLGLRPIGSLYPGRGEHGKTEVLDRCGRIGRWSRPDRRSASDRDRGHRWGR